MQPDFLFIKIVCQPFYATLPANLTLSQRWISIKELLRVGMLTPGNLDESRNVIRKVVRPLSSVLTHQRLKETQRDGETCGMFCFIRCEIVGLLFIYGVWRSVGEVAY